MKTAKDTELAIIAMVERYEAEWKDTGNKAEALACADIILGIRFRRDHAEPLEEATP